MSPEEIKAELKARNISMAEIGRRLRPKVSTKTVSVNVAQYPGQKSARVRRAIANAIGRPVAEVFAEGASLQKVG